MSKQGDVMEPTKQQVDSLLDKLSNDDAFRKQFEGDPVAALMRLGVSIDAACCKDFTTLASKEELAQARESLQKTLASTLDQSVHKLEAR